MPEMLGLLPLKGGKQDVCIRRIKDENSLEVHVGTQNS